MIYFCGAGNFGGHIAYLLSQTVPNSIPLIFSTSTEDTSNMKTDKIKDIIQIISSGNGKNFQIGEKLWKQEKVIQDLTKYLEPINENDRVYIVGSLGGGTGSSSFTTLTDIISKKTKNIGIITVLPHESSVNFIVNAYFSLSSLVSLQKKASILVLNNEDLLKKNDNDIIRTNDNIVKEVVKCFFLKDIDNKDLKTVWAIDDRDFTEIIKPGFVNVNECSELSFKQEVVQFPSYGNLKRVKRMAIIKNIDEKQKDKMIDTISADYQEQVQKFIKKFGANTITHYGIIRSNFLDNDKFYIIGNGFNIEPLLLKLKSKANVHIEKLKSIKDAKKVNVQRDKKNLSFEEI